ncbi:MAG: hypothetical protein WBC04_23355 [Candidatus Acidiferrales bacterium]
MQASRKLGQQSTAVNPTPHVEKSHAVGNSKSLQATLEGTIIRMGGGIPCGYLSAIPSVCEKLCLFNSPRTHSTYALPCSQLSARNVRRHIAEHDKLFTQAQSEPKLRPVCHQVDFHLADHGSIYILAPLNEAAIAWVEENVGRESGYHPDYPALVIEPRYVSDLMRGMFDAGFDVSTEVQR